jgi:hypothetical protein
LIASETRGALSDTYQIGVIFQEGVKHFDHFKTEELIVNIAFSYPLDNNSKREVKPNRLSHKSNDFELREVGIR